MALDLVARQKLSSKWGWFVALGVLLVMGGGIALANLFVATVVSVYYVGAIMLVAGLLQLFHAYRVKGWQSVLYWGLAGGCYTIAGIFAFINPLLTSAVLTLIMGVALLVAGLFRIWSGFTLRPLKGWGWIALGGLVTFLAGLIILAGWPVNSLWILGLFLAIDITMQGLALIAFGVLAKA
ncbi:uncharacterized membrane protein HdeD (DUF308 family) [Pararhizobium capsulatum DSM 1112]|uniref:Uncharacterized membrane protein HdeD (DUF308 family) n=1 Tax=Pararhizobium capsulatum DSM 1112 TaxID=1121113 RepID=A0ABU0BML7_9HYPH|nr:HdeD family acid-resistance protein [Pararhizobium capsulatum]MDQ0319501.1 uncharacterized membrane protein HdeD (DUF308 family) [Pararhizobium capsulatum DSM 1112]